jgi:alanyl-tRNA synthetase
MHKALREVLGDHVQQKGSLVDAEKTRFDFTHNAPVTDDQIREIERRVNAEILANAPPRRA